MFWISFVLVHFWQEYPWIKCISWQFLHYKGQIIHRANAGERLELNILSSKVRFLPTPTWYEGQVCHSVQGEGGWAVPLPAPTCLRGALPALVPTLLG